MRQHSFRRSIALASLATLTLVSAVATATSASAEIEYPWCLMPNRFTPQSCTFSTLEQCKATEAGNSGFCARNPRYTATQPVRQRR